jgi:hypothetical protein
MSLQELEFLALCGDHGFSLFFSRQAGWQAASQGQPVNIFSRQSIVLRIFIVKLI